MVVSIRRPPKYDGVDGLTRLAAKLEATLPQKAQPHPLEPRGTATDPVRYPLLRSTNPDLSQELQRRGWSLGEGSVNAGQIRALLHQKLREMRDLLLHRTVDDVHRVLKQGPIETDEALAVWLPDTLKATRRAGLWFDLRPLTEKWGSYIDPKTVGSEIHEGREFAESTHGFNEIEAILDRFLQDPSTIDKKDIGQLLTIVAKNRGVLEGALRRKAEVVLHIAQRIVDHHPPWEHVALRPDTCVGLHALFGPLTAPHVGKQVWYAVNHNNGFSGTYVNDFLSFLVRSKSSDIPGAPGASTRHQAAQALIATLPPYIGSGDPRGTVQSAAAEARIRHNLLAMRRGGDSKSTDAFEAALGQMASALIAYLGDEQARRAI
jgi:hypothetical protein